MLIATPSLAKVYTNDKENMLVMTLATGDVIIKLRPDLAPNHVKRIKQLVRDGYYKGIKFHRVIPNFIAQTGDPSGKNIGTGTKIDAEFSSEKHIRGTVSMARHTDINSADDQWFICLAPAPHLDNIYTIWGEVISGMEHIDKVKQSPIPSGMVKNPTPVLDLQVSSDISKN